MGPIVYRTVGLHVNTSIYSNSKHGETMVTTVKIYIYILMMSSSMFLQVGYQHLQNAPLRSWGNHNFACMIF